jgi:hypothetical protein
MKTYHNRKREVPIVPTFIVNFIELAAKIKTQPIKLGKIHVHYPCIMFSSMEHRYGECPRKFEV